MSTVTLRIQVDRAGATEGIGQVKRDLREMGDAGQQSGQQAAGGFNALRSSIDGARAVVASFLAAYAGIQTLTGVVRLADEYQGLSDRVRLATGEGTAFAAAQAGIFSIAQQTGTALSAVGGLYVSLANSTRELGLSQGQLQTITQAVSQSFIVSGASAAQTDAAIRQLGQGFASGVLRGDEFNSMMENAPALASALAASLGVTTGELRQMAAEGALTADVLAQGILQQAPQIASQFDQMGTTVGQAFTRLSNAVLQFVGEANQASGAGSALAAVITGIANNLPAVVAGLGALAGGYTAVAAAAAVANPALGYTATLLAGLATALGVVVVAYSAYKLGEYLANEFQVVREAGAYLIVSLNAVWEALKNGAFAAFTAVRVAWSVVVDAIQEKLADLIASFVELGQFEIFGQSVDFTYGQAEALDTLVQSLRGATDGAAETDAAMAELRAKFDASAQASQSLSDGLFEGVDAYFATRTAAGEAADGIERTGNAARLSEAEIRKLKQVLGEGERAALATATELERLAAEMGGPAIAAAIELAQRLRASDERMQGLTAAYQAGGLATREYTAAMQSESTIRGLLLTQYGQQAARLRDLGSAVDQHLAQLREEVRIAGLTGTARAAAIAQMNAERTARRLLTDGTAEQVSALAQQILALEQQGAAAERAARSAEAWGKYWDGAIDSVATAFGDFVANGMDDFESFGDALKNIAKQIVSDLVSEFARLELINPLLNGLLGGSRQTGGSMLGNLLGGGGAGGGGLFGNMFGGAGGGFASALPVIGWIMAGMAANNSLYDSGWRPGQGDKPAGAAYYSLATLTPTAMLSGVADRLLRGLGLDGRTASMLSGSAVVQRLFGRSAPELTGSTTTVDFGDQSVSQQLRTLERGGIFRSDRRRTRTGEVSDEAIEAAEQLFAQIEATMTNAARDLESTAPQMIDAAFRTVQEYDRDGKVKATQYFVDVLGRSWEEATAEAAVSRINSEALISTIDAALGGVEASTIAERWRADAISLADGSQFLLMAAADIRRGTSLLGDTTLTEVTDFVEGLQGSGESLSQAYTRLAASAQLVDETFTFLEVQFRGTRAEAVTFAAELVNMAGGLDAFSARLRGALEALFSEDERNQFLADQAQSTLNEALRGLNISGVGLESIRTQLRDQLREAMASGNAELVNQILIAANALGAFSSALEALGEDAVASAASLALGGTSLRPGGSLTSPGGTGLGPGGAPGATAPTTQLEAGQATVRELTRQTGILERIATNTARTEEQGAEKAARDTASAATTQVGLLRDIKTMIESAVRNAVQETLKASTGANSRGQVTA